MRKTDKSEINETVGRALAAILKDLKLSAPSKKVTKAFSKVSKALRKDVKANRKKLDAKQLAKAKPLKKGKSSRMTEGKSIS